MFRLAHPDTVKGINLPAVSEANRRTVITMKAVVKFVLAWNFLQAQERRALGDPTNVLVRQEPPGRLSHHPKAT